MSPTNQTRRTAVRLLARLLVALLVVWLVLVLALWVAARDDGGRWIPEWMIPEWLGQWIWWLMHATGLKKFEAPH